MQINITGIIKDGPQKFTLNGNQFNKLAKPVIVNTCPFIPIDNNEEESAYATLLLHTPWPREGEGYIVPSGTTAVSRLKQLMGNNMIPTYVLPMLSRQATSSALTNNYGVQPAQQTDEHTSDTESECDDLDETDITLQYPTDEYRQISLTTTTDGVLQINIEKSNYYANFIQRSQEDFLQKEKIQNQKTPCTSIIGEVSSNSYEEVNNYEERIRQLAIDVLKLTTSQRNAYDKAVKRISSNEQLLMFISGEGGTGKTFVISLIQEFTKLRYGKQLGLYGATVAMAPTGCAANVVRGYTWQSCYGKGRSKDKTETKKLSSLTAKKIGSKFDGTKLLVLDEISMINLENIAEISDRHIAALKSLTEDKQEQEIINSKLFGGVHVLFTGDLWQLKAIGGHTIYSTKVLSGKALEGQNIWRSINEYSELKENYRFRNDPTPTLKTFLSGARIGRVDSELLDLVNKRIVLSRQEASRLADPSAVWIAHTKKTVSSFNDADFLEKIKRGNAHFRIVAKHSSAQDIVPAPDSNVLKTLFQTVKKNGIPTHIDLAIGTRVSCTQNLGTQIGDLYLKIY